MSKKVAYIDQNIPLLADSLSGYYEVKEFYGDSLNNEILVDSKAELLVSRSNLKISDVLLKNTNVKYYASATSGSNHVDFNYLNDKGIENFIAKGCNANSVAEYVIYNISKLISFEGLKNKTIGIIGFGNIGKLVAKYCNILGIKVLVNDPPLFDDNFPFPDFVQYSSLKEIFTKSDIVTNHVPLTNSGDYPTQYLINEKLINKIKPSSIFIHASRGGVVEESALLKRDDLNLIIDVWEDEPDYNNDLANKALISTPHIAGHSRNGKLNASIMISNWLGSKTNQTFKIDTDLPERTEFNSSSAETLLKEVIKERKIDRDSEFMKKEGSSDWFKNYRKNYPVRYERVR